MIINMNGAKAPETPSSVLQEKTVTPETLPTVIGPDEGYDGLSQVTVNPDSQLIPTNIRSGKTIFGVEGSFVGETVSVPTAYGSIRPLSSVYEAYYVQVGTSPGLDIPEKTMYNGSVHYSDRKGSILDVELRRIVASNWFDNVASSFNDYYVIDYDERTIKLNYGYNITFPYKFTTQLNSSKTKKVQLLLYAQMSASIYGFSVRSNLIHPIKTVEVNVEVSTSSSKNYLYVYPSNIDVTIPAGKVAMSEATLSRYANSSNARMGWGIYAMITDLDFSDLYE